MSKKEMEKPDVIIGCDSRLSFLANNNRLPLWSHVPKTKITKPKKIVMGCSSHVLIWCKSNSLELHHKDLGVKKYQLPNESISDIASGSNTYLVLTKSGTVYSLADGGRYNEVPFKDPQNSKWDSLRKVDFFTKKNISIKQIGMGYCNDYFLAENGDYYANGKVWEGRTGKSHAEQNLPIIICSNVDKIFSGPHGLGIFVIKTNNELFSSGNNSSKKLGLGNIQDQKVLKKVTCSGFEPKDIVKLVTGQYHSTLLTNDGNVFSCGGASQSGHGVETNTFTEIAELKEKVIILLSSGEYHQLAITQELELFGWGFQVSPTSGSVDYKKPVKITLPNFPVTRKMRIDCGSSSVMIYNTANDDISSDFELFFANKKFSDTFLGSKEYEITCHKLILECRTKLKIEDIQKIFIQNSSTKEEIITFLRWVYYGEQSNSTLLKKVFDSLNLTFSPNDNLLENDLIRLFNDEDSKDFSLLIKDDEEEEYDEEEDEEENFEEIPVHKFILLARSGLFREMFENLNEKEKEISEIKDYSGKSIDSIEILIKFFYTNKIELTADHDPILILEELSDAVEYYQLNEDSSLTDELAKIKRQYKIN
ncbi:btk-binding protein-related [Anaeramoeba flamelloides]|uniref:Btk-binding protein-related n=1 Tax=Anaeramoeba flamelloides TaxID=1746091 RepID=A0ABQ8XKC0_9EUKA|nr:btk-binding protein-related [Anaeramoeba flamelloides]